MATTLSQPTTVEYTDEEPRRAWAEYHASGMPALIGAAHLGAALSALDRTGLAKKLAAGALSETDVVSDMARPDLGAELLRYLAVRGIVERTDGTVTLTERGKLLLGDISLAQLGFYFEAYGPVVHELAGLLSETREYGRDVLRNGEALGRHCATLFTVFHTPIVLDALAEHGARCLLDLGCGGGRLLVDACERNSDLRGVGLDIAPDAIDFARRLAAERGLEDRLTFVVGDAFEPDSWPKECFAADALCAVGVVHEHFRDGEEAVIKILDIYAELIRDRMKVFVLGEPELRYDDEENDADLFLVHIFTAQGYPRPQSEWLRLFPRSQLECRRVRTRTNAGPRFCFYELAPR